MSKTPLVSIIMAVKDTEPYLPSCLDSILNQTYFNWELIAVNDHSTDQTEAILKRYAKQDKRITTFNGTGHRLIPTLQEAYNASSGVLINRMDSDDRMPHDKIETLVNKWLNYGIGHIIAGGTEHFVDEGEVGGGFIRYENWLNEVAKKSSHYEEIYQECVIPSHCWIIHREDFNKVGAFNPIVYPEDYDLCFRFYKEGLNVIGIDKILHYWRDRTERISRTWIEYEDNRFFDLKLRYFFELDRDKSRPIVVWGAGRNGKDLIKLLQAYQDSPSWVCDNEKKVGKDIYGIKMKSVGDLWSFINPQILIAVTSPIEKKLIRDQLIEHGKQPVKDFWFFV